MYNILFVIKSSLEDFRRNKLRTLLTSLGILIGVSSVVLLLAFGLGMKRYIEMQFESLGTNLIMIMPGGMMRGGNINAGPGLLSGIRYDEKDVLSLKKIKSLSVVVPVNEFSLRISAKGKEEYASVVSSNEDIFEGLNLEIDHGKEYNKADAAKHSKDVVLGVKIAEKLFGNHESAIGEKVKINDINYHVIGVLKSKGGGGMGEAGLDEHVFVPHNSSSVVSPQDNFLALYAKSTKKDNLETSIEEIKKVLLKRYEEDEFSVMNQSQLMEAINSIIGVINMVLLSVAAISLVVGGVGIMNIMYVSVAERINEIGLRRSVGATRKDILALFIAESVLLSVIGGIIGVLLSYLVILLIQPYFPAYINASTILISTGVSAAIGILFGYIPARKASFLTPIDAIRHEE